MGGENIKVKSVPIEKRLGQENYNNQNCLMKIVEYKNYDNIVVEFQDDYKYKTKKHIVILLTEKYLIHSFQMLKELDLLEI